MYKLLSIYLMYDDALCLSNKVILYKDLVFYSLLYCVFKKLHFNASGSEASAKSFKKVLKPSIKQEVKVVQAKSQVYSYSSMT